MTYHILCILVCAAIVATMIYISFAPSRGRYYPPGTVLYVRRGCKWERVTVEESKFRNGLWLVKTDGKGFRPSCFYHSDKPKYCRK